MLGKVLKYEIKSSGRFLLPAFALSVALACVMRFMLFITPYVWEPIGALLSALAGSLGFLLLFAIVILTFIFAIVRFYQGMSSNEAYLTYTLPVNIDTHIFGRLISGTIFTLGSVIIAVLCGLVFIPGFFSGLTSMSLLHAGVQIFELPVDIWLSVIGLIVVFLVTTIIFLFMQIYASLAIGTKITRNNILGGIAGYFILNTAKSFVSLIFTIPMMSILGSTNNQVMEYFMRWFPQTNDRLTTVRSVLLVIWMGLGVLSLINLIFAVAHYFITRYFYGKKLNLE